MFVSIHSMTSESHTGRKYKIETKEYDIHLDQNHIEITAKEFTVPNTGERGGSYLETHRKLIIKLTKSEVANITQFSIDNNLIKLCVK